MLMIIITIGELFKNRLPLVIFFGVWSALIFFSELSFNGVSITAVNPLSCKFFKYSELGCVS